MLDPITGTAALLLLKGKVAAFLAKAGASHAAGAAATAHAGGAAAAPYYVGPDPSSACYGAGGYYGPDPSQAYYASGGYYGGGYGQNLASQAAQHFASNAAGKVVNAYQDQSIRGEIHDMLQLLVYEQVVPPWKADMIWEDAKSSSGWALINIWRGGMTTIRQNGLD